MAPNSNIEDQRQADMLIWFDHPRQVYATAVRKVDRDWPITHSQVPAGWHNMGRLNRRSAEHMEFAMISCYNNLGYQRIGVRDTGTDPQQLHHPNS